MWIKTYHQQTNSTSLLKEVEVQFQVQLLFLSFLCLWRGPARKLLLLLGLPFYLFISQSLVLSFFFFFFHFSLIGMTYNLWTVELKCSWLLKKVCGRLEFLGRESCYWKKILVLGEKYFYLVFFQYSHISIR